MSTEKINIREKKEEEQLIPQIFKALKSIRYGYVQITVQDSKIVQIEKVEKFRVKHALGFYT